MSRAARRFPGPVFKAAGSRALGSGWVWLIVNPKGTLEVVSTATRTTADDLQERPGHPLARHDVLEARLLPQVSRTAARLPRPLWSVVNCADGVPIATPKQAA